MHQATTSRCCTMFVQQHAMRCDTQRGLLPPHWARRGLAWEFGGKSTFPAATSLQWLQSDTFLRSQSYSCFALANDNLHGRRMTGELDAACRFRRT